DENKFLWKDVTGFAIIEDPENAYNKKVIFETTRPIAPKISLPIDRSSVNPDTLKSFLLLHSTEKELKESVVKAIAEKVRF
ncbi:MAG: hypothetical protein QG594_924, partial [Bacteroidota bacterium]|nr:hypothetical protein [Bacteroidota bacterium]